MRVALTCDRSGRGLYQAAGEIIDLPPAEARALIRAGSAEEVSDASLPAETAALEPPETAARVPPSPKPNRGRRRSE